MPTCPNCKRALPQANLKVCVYCGTNLNLTPTRSPSLGFGFASRPTRDPLIGQEVAGRFLVEELIGQGGMGKVYKARHLALDKTVVLKMLKPALLEDPTLVGRFEREAKAASRLNHANVIQVLDFGRIGDEGTLYIAMEFVTGKDLRLVLRDEWPIAEERLCNIVAQVLSALAEAHAHNVIHRDLKPENIMVEQRRDAPDFVKVLDFGIAKIMDSDVPGLTRNDVVCGTPQYMAPEQATGSALDPRCDLYAVGVILYQLCTGHLPFDGQNSMEVLTKHVNDLPVPPRQKQPEAPISEAMEKLILCALEKDPSARPQTAEEFRQRLLAVPQQASSARAVTLTATDLVEAKSTPAHDPHAQTAEEENRNALAARMRSRRLPLAAGAAVLLLGGAAALVALQKPGPAAKPAVPQPAPRAAADVPAAPPTATLTATGVSPAASGGTGPAAAATPAPAPVPSPTIAAPPANPADPARALELLRQAVKWQHEDRLDIARDFLEQAEAADPQNAEVHFRLGDMFSQSQPARARSEYELSSKLNPGKYSAEVKLRLDNL